MKHLTNRIAIASPGAPQPLASLAALHHFFPVSVPYKIPYASGCSHREGKKEEQDTEGEFFKRLRIAPLPHSHGVLAAVLTAPFFLAFLHGPKRPL